MKVKEKNRFKSHLICGSFILLFGIYLISIKYVDNYYKDKRDQRNLNNFFNEENLPTNNIENKAIVNKKSTINVENNYIAVLEIPKINIKRGLLAIDNKYNNIEYNITILKGSDYPDVENGNFILASHSGTGRIAFFSNLNKLNIDDYVYVYYKKIKYTYKVNNKYLAEKNGTLKLSASHEKSIITLTTCDPNSKSKQLIVGGELVATDSY